jgi:hypothetical protein
MLRLPVRTWILNAAAVSSGRHGAVTRQAQQAGCSRPTVYRQAQEVERRLTAAAAGPPSGDPPSAGAAPTPTAAPQATIDDDRRRRMATTAFAMGLSLRQIEELLAILLPGDEVPDHTTLGRWVQADARRAGAVLAALDPVCAPKVTTLACDEVFFGGTRPSSPSSRPA